MHSARYSDCNARGGGAAMLFLTGMCEYKIEENRSFLRLK